MKKNPQEQTGGKPRRWVALGIVITILAAIGVCIQQANVTPTVSIPPPHVLPSPNARDIYADVADNINTVAGGRDHGALIWMDEPARIHSLQQRAATVKTVEPELARLHEAFNYECLAPAARTISQMQISPAYLKYRQLAYYLRFAGQVKAEQGDWNGAITCCLDAMRVGRDMAKGGGMMDMLMGIDVQSAGREGTRTSMEHLNAMQAKKAIKRLSDILAGTATFAEALQEEKWTTQAILLEVFKSKNWRKELSEWDSGLVGQGQSKLLLANKRQIMRGYTEYMDQLIAQAHRPYLEREDVQPPKGPAGIFAPVFARAGAKEAVNQTMNRLLLLQLALRAYKLEHGQYPATLEELTKGYLTQLPTDPFAKSGAFRYALQGKTYLLYSLGPDGRDDGGKPIENPNAKKPEQRYLMLDMESRGDIVAGINK